MDQKSPAEMIIDMLGGLTKTAKALSTDEKTVAISTVQGWKERKKIPQEYWLPLMSAGAEIGVTIELPMFLGQTADAA